MKKEKILYGVKIGEQDWEKQVLTVEPWLFEEATEWAKNNGFDRIEIVEIDLSEKPDFITAINVTKKTKSNNIK